MGLKKVHLGFFVPEGDGLVNQIKIFPRFEESSKFMIAAAQWYFARHQEKELFINPIESMLSAIHRQEPLDDIVCPIISGSMDIDWNGDAATCLEVGGGLEPEWLGNVFDESVVKVANSHRFRKKVIAATAPKRYCLSCEYQNICRSACSVLHQFWNPAHDDDCPGFKTFIDYVKAKYDEGMLPKYSEIRDGTNALFKKTIGHGIS
jgi:radical SAM protein with 4Fe4S-binding SPASM domain